MYMQNKRVVAIHDLSGVGRCSLTVIMPILSAMGVQACPVPTAILSTHTGGFGEVAFQDLTDYLPQALAHYQRLGLDFSCIYSGFLDHGKPYRTVTEGMRRRMVELVSIADVITPNLTEACILLGEPYHPMPLTRAQAKSMLARLSEKGPQKIVITGVSLAEGNMANIGYDQEHNYYWCVPCDYVPVSYPGTGDIFAAVLTASFLIGDSLPIAMSRASRFVEIAIKTTFSYGGDTRFGVMLESAMPFLMQREVPQNFHLL